ncbi:MAG: glycosyltransferase [Dermatophilaceae bacterium]
MKVGILAIDSRGGVQPLLALGTALRDAGHEVRMLAPAEFNELVTAAGVEFAPIALDVKGLLERREGSGLGSRRDQIRMAREELPGLIAGWMRDALPALDGVEMMLTGLGGRMVARAVAERLRVPCVDVILQPVGPPTSEFPGVFLPHPPRWLGGAGRWASHVATNAMITLPVRRAVARARVETLDLPPSPAPDDDTPVLYGYSPALIPRPRSWGTRRHVVGYWTMPLDDGWQPPAALAEFLEQGPAPVCIGFGSMPAKDPERLAHHAVEAARRAGHRTVLLSGWAGLDIADAVDVHVEPSVPHEWLFPRTAAVVHHGGAGTTGAAVRAGVPSVVVTWGADQPFWASRLAHAGVAAPPIDHDDLDTDRLAAALILVTTDDAMRERARRLGERVSAEQGEQAALDALTSAGLLR